MKINLRHITEKDIDILYDWRNHESTRVYFFNQDSVEYNIHQDYVRSMIKDQDRNQYMLEIDGVSVATIKDQLSDSIKELSYTVSPDYRGKRVSTLLMTVYLHENFGDFLCRIFENNIASIKMVERCGFKLEKVVDSVCHYKISR